MHIIVAVKWFVVKQKKISFFVCNLLEKSFKFDLLALIDCRGVDGILEEN